MWKSLTEPIERTGVLMSLSSLSTAELQELQQGLTELEKSRLWPDFQRSIELNRIEASVIIKISQAPQLALLLPQNLKDLWQRSYEQTLHRQQERLRSANNVLRRLDEEKIPWVLLKGQSLCVDVYKNPAYKKMNDIDILVHRKDLGRLHQIFSNQKMISMMQLAHQDHRQQEKYSHHWPPFASEDLKCLWGVYWTLVSPLRKYNLDIARVWDRLQRAPWIDREVLRLAPEDLLHHLCLHLGLFKTGIKEVQDIYNLVRHFDTSEPGFDWDFFLKTVHQTGSQDDVYHALRVAFAYSGEAKLDQVAQSLEAKVSTRMKKFVRRKCACPLTLAWSRSDHVGHIEQLYAYFTLTPSSREKAYFLLKMWQAFLFPPQAEALRMNFAATEKGFFTLLFSRIQAPYFISLSFVREFGWKLHLLLMLRHPLVVVTTLFARARAGTCGKGNLQTLLQSAGIQGIDQLAGIE